MVFVGLLVVGCGSSAVRSAPVAAPVQPRVVIARRIPAGRFRPVKPGTMVSKGLSSERVFANARRGITLAQIASETFPAATTDGGRHWWVDGPVPFADAADGPLAVSDVGTAGPHTYFAYGGGGSVVDITTDGGKTWWNAFLGEGVLAVVPITHGKLVAVVQQQASSESQSLKSVTWTYVSTDGGRHWRATDLLGG
jgi:hypothetical protein